MVKKILKLIFTISQFHHLTFCFAEVAHLVERKPSKLQVAGSSPVFRSEQYNFHTLNSHPIHTLIAFVAQG